jgi:hypothetical protein
MLQDIVENNTYGHAVERADINIKVGSKKKIRMTMKG